MKNVDEKMFNEKLAWLEAYKWSSSGGYRTFERRVANV